MKLKSFILSVLLCILFSIPVNAAMNPDRVLLPNYQLEHPGQSTLFLTTPENLTCNIELRQFSEEREFFVLYDFSSSSETCYGMALEPGNYAIWIEYSLTSDQALQREILIEFELENTDYIDEYKRMSVDFVLQHETLDANSFILMTDSGASQMVADNCAIVNRTVSVNSCDALTGDLDGDGIFTTKDSTFVLFGYVLEMMGNESALTPFQLAVSDFDFDGHPSADEAVQILRYYALSLSGADPNWGEILK